MEMERRSFEETWTLIRRKCYSGLQIPNWTQARGNLGDTMVINAVSDTAISFDAPRAKNIQHAPRKDFETLWNIWPDYLSGKVKRYEIRDLTRFSKYIISTLHWLEEN